MCGPLYPFVLWLEVQVPMHKSLPITEVEVLIESCKTCVLQAFMSTREFCLILIPWSLWGWISYFTGTLKHRGMVACPRSLTQEQRLCPCPVAKTQSLPPSSLGFEFSKSEGVFSLWPSSLVSVCTKCDGIWMHTFMCSKGFKMHQSCHLNAYLLHPTVC